jgi:hypothetical protein
MTRKTVQREALYQKTSRSFSYIFERINQDDIKQYKHRQFLSPSLADDVNENVSLISYAYLLDNSIAKRVVDFFDYMSYNLDSSGRSHSSDDDLISTSKIFNESSGLRKQAEDLLCLIQE